jgi:hypothetical protein
VTLKNMALVGLIGFAVLFIYLAARSAVQGAQELMLRSRGQSADAKVLAQCDAGSGFGVHYQFALGGAAYTAGDWLGRHDLCQAIRGNMRTTTVRVLYLPGNPWVNRPADPPSSPSVVFLASCVMALVCVAALALILLRDYRAYRAIKRADPNARFT